MVEKALPSVTIGIPFYNADRFLMDAVKSVFSQTHQDWELILMDDGSTDRSLEIARSIDDPRVRVYSDGKNKKLAARLNEINSLAKYDYVARMDADDLMLPNRISELLALLQDNPEYDLASCGTYSVDDSLNLIGQRGQDTSEFTFRGLIERRQIFLHAGLVAKRSWFERNIYNEKLLIAQDTELWCRAAKAGDFRAISISKPLYIYREAGNVSRNKLLAAYKTHRAYIFKLIDRKSERAAKIFKSLGKSAAVVALDSVGQLGYLLSRRQCELTQSSVIEYERARDVILEKQIPTFRG